MFRETCVGVTGIYTGRMAREGLAKPSASSGGQEHCFCTRCREWLLRSNTKLHSCQDVGKPHDRPLWRVFQQPWDGLELRLFFQHQTSGVEISCVAGLHEAAKLLLWPEVWDAETTGSWRLVGPERLEENTKLELRVPCCKSVPGQPRRFLLSSAQLVMLGWMRSQESQVGYVSRQVVRQAVIESDLAVELKVERKFESRGGLVLTRGQKPASSEEPSCYDAGVAMCLLSLIDEEVRQRSTAQSPMLTRRRCRIEAAGTLILVHHQALQHWQQVLESASGHTDMRALVITTQRRMRSLTVADIIGADLIIASTQLFSSEAYQRHFDQLSKPGLDVWDAASLSKRQAAQEIQEEKSAASDSEPLFTAGDLVVLSGLISKAHLNGRLGQLIAWDEDAGRWSCLLQSPAKGTSKGGATSVVPPRKRGMNSQLVNVRPYNLKAARGSGRPRAQAKRRQLEQPPLKVSKYYAELRAREDYLARRQVELELHTLRLLRQAVTFGLSSTEEANTGTAAEEVQQAVHPLLASAASEVVSSPALLEMFRFRRLIFDDCHLLARSLGQLVSGTGTFSGGVNQYLSKVAPFYAVHAIEAHIRWGIAPVASVLSDGGASEDVAPLASLLGIQLPWSDGQEARRFLETWAVAAEEGDDVPRILAQRQQAQKISGDLAGRVGFLSEEMHWVKFSTRERFIYLFRWLEQCLAAKYVRGKKASRDEQVRALLQLCTCDNEDVASFQDTCFDGAQRLFNHVVSHWQSKSADSALVEAQEAEFELRLNVFKTLGLSVPGYEREVLLASAHSDAQQLKGLIEEPGLAPEPIKVQLRRLAQAAVEGVCDRATKVPRRAKEPHHLMAEGSGAERSQHVTTRAGCSACNQITEARDVIARLRLASSRAVATERRAAQRLRCAGVLAATFGLKHLEAPRDFNLSLQCVSGCQGIDGKRLLFPCGHILHAECLAATGECPVCQLAFAEDEAVCLHEGFGIDQFQSAFSSKVLALVEQVKSILPTQGAEGAGTCQCLVFSQWPSSMTQLEAALAQEGFQAYVPCLLERPARAKDEGAKSPDKTIVLLSPDLLHARGRDAGDEMWREHVLAPCAVRHVLLLHPLHTSMGKQQSLERRLLDIAQTDDVALGITPAVILHRFVMRDTVEAELLGQPNLRG